MAYKKEELIEQSLDAITTNNLFFIDDISAYLPCSRSTFYNQELDKLDSIKGALNKNKIKTKSAMRSKWYKSENATLQIALMKLIATDTERKKIAQSYTDVTSDDQPMTIALVEFVNGDDNNKED